jgi:Pentapeptide repeats (8 copies)
VTVNENNITLEHLAQACAWAKQPTPIAGLDRKYDQGHWDCGTACCLWGGASLIAGEGPANTGPSSNWADTPLKVAVRGLLNSPMTTPEQLEELLSGADLSGADLSGADLRGANLRDADLRGADLSGADLSGADLSGANLRDADLSGANLRDADLRGADLRDATVRVGNVNRRIA